VGDELIVEGKRWGEEVEGTVIEFGFFNKIEEEFPLVLLPFVCTDGGIAKLFDVTGRETIEGLE
jgi:hypothetical protein